MTGSCCWTRDPLSVTGRLSKAHKEREKMKTDEEKERLSNAGAPDKHADRERDREGDRDQRGKDRKRKHQSQHDRWVEFFSATRRRARPWCSFRDQRNKSSNWIMMPSVTMWEERMIKSVPESKEETRERGRRGRGVNPRPNAKENSKNQVLIRVLNSKSSRAVC
ncbi:UNVERIFIED_CONTAM: hypothetical protein FKN15_036795 [Acipenser sinensis]